jgi:hypothetical protein
MEYVERVAGVTAEQITAVTVTAKEFVLSFSSGKFAFVPSNSANKPEVGDYWVTRPDGSGYVAYQKSFESRYTPLDFRLRVS